MPSTCDSGSAPRRPRRGAAARRRRFAGGTRSSVEMHEQSTLERSRWVLELTTALSAAVTPRQVASAVSRAGLVAMGAATAHLFWHRGGEGLERVASLGDGPRSAEAAPAVFHARLLAAEADRTGAPVWSDELAAVPVVVNGATVAVLGSRVCVSTVVRAGRSEFAPRHRHTLRASAAPIDALRGRGREPAAGQRGRGALETRAGARRARRRPRSGARRREDGGRGRLGRVRRGCRDAGRGRKRRHETDRG